MDFDPENADCIENRIKRGTESQMGLIYKKRTELEYYRHSEEGKPFTIMDLYGIYILKL